MPLKYQIVTETLVHGGPNTPRVTPERGETVISTVPPATTIHYELMRPEIRACGAIIGGRHCLVRRGERRGKSEWA
jgi:hypothetical protein